MSEAPMDALMGAWGTIAPDFWSADDTPLQEQRPSPPLQAAAVAAVAAVAAAPSPSGPPPEHRDRINAVISALARPGDRGALHTASATAQALDHEITAAYGEAHTHTVNIRELRGLLALETGQPDAAARWFLHTTGLQVTVWGADHPQTRASAERAVYAWSRITTDDQARQRGEKVLAVLQQILGARDVLTVRVARHLAKTDQRRRPGTD